MSLLTMIRSCATKIGIARPETVIDNTDIEVLELLEFAQEEGRELAKRGNWHVLRKEFTFATVALETQSNYSITDLGHIIPNTTWNRTRKLPLKGPLKPQSWQAAKAFGVSPVYNSYTIRGSSFLMSPVPTAGDNIYGEYISKNFCSAGSAWAADANTGVLDETLMGLGIIVRFKLAKGLDATSDLAKYETQVRTALEEEPSETIDMEGGMRAAGVVIPDGNWQV